MEIWWCIILPQMPIVVNTKVAKISVAEIMVGRQTFSFTPIVQAKVHTVGQIVRMHKNTPFQK